MGGDTAGVVSLYSMGSKNWNIFRKTKRKAVGYIVFGDYVRKAICKGGRSRDGGLGNG